MPNGVLLRLLGTLTVLALIASGCGGGSSSGSSAGDGSSSDGTASVTVETSALSKAQFVKKANAICEKQSQAVGPVVNKALRTGSSVKSVEAAVLPAGERILEQVRALGAPSGDEAQVEAFLAALQGDIDNARKHPSASMEAFAKLFKDSGNLARGYGVGPCAFG